VSPTTTTTLRDDVGELLASAGVELTGTTIDLNVARLALCSNLPEFQGRRYFARFDEATTPEYRLNCVDLDAHRLDEASLDRVADRTFRAKRFRTGFYLTHHFGPPAWITTRGKETTIFGRDLEKIVWTYYIKQMLTTLCADHGWLHLKAAGLVGPDGGATLLFGRGSGGKTVFLTQSCLAGAGFLTNTHVVIQGDVAFGVPSAMRVRDDACFGAMIRELALPRHLQSDEYVLDPNQAFPAAVDSAPVRNLCVIDYRPEFDRGIRRLDPRRFYQFIDQFAFPPSTYGLKDDLLAHVGGDMDHYLDAYGRMKDTMRTTVENANLFHINVDMLDPDQRARALEVLFS